MEGGKKYKMQLLPRCQKVFSLNLKTLKDILGQLVNKQVPIFRFQWMQAAF